MTFGIDGEYSHPVHPTPCELSNPNSFLTATHLPGDYLPQHPLGIDATTGSQLGDGNFRRGPGFDQLQGPSLGPWPSTSFQNSSFANQSAFDDPLPPYPSFPQLEEQCFDALGPPIVESSSTLGISPHEMERGSCEASSSLSHEYTSTLQPVPCGFTEARRTPGTFSPVAHHPAARPPSPISLASSGLAKNYDCERGCSRKSFTSAKDRNRHYRSEIHRTASLALYKCRCNYSTPRRDHFLRHLNHRDGHRKCAGSSAYFECICSDTTRTADYNAHLGHVEKCTYGLGKSGRRKNPPSARAR